MCGRYVLSDTEAVKKKFKIEVKASHNIAPSQDVLVLKPNPEMMTWSYSPKWKEDMNLINCRHETLLEKPSFKGSMRCIFIANGWIEWLRSENEKKPFFHYIRSELIYFAGIYNLTSGCAVVTCQSAEHIAQVHHRQPLLLEERQIDEWISGKHQIDRKIDDHVEFHEISKKVNSPKNNNTQLLLKI
jgi:putative SOS response-associated peptidase YedK